MKSRTMGLLAALLLAAQAAPPKSPVHHPDAKKCKRCLEALNKAFAYVKANYDKGGFLDALPFNVFGGFLFMIGGGNEADLKKCVSNCCRFVDKKAYNCNWFMSMSMFFLAEYASRFGMTPEIQAALQRGLKFAAEQEEETGGWCHHLGMWKEDGYNKRGGGRDLGIVTAMAYSSFVEMKRLGVDPGPLLERSRKNLESLGDGYGFSYGTDNKWGDICMSRGSYVLLGLVNAGQVQDPLLPKIMEGIRKRYTKIPGGHAYAPLHYFGVGAAMHRMGPADYRKFLDQYLDPLIDAQGADGAVTMDHDGGNKGAGQSNAASTAVFACLLLMQQDGVFRPKPPAQAAPKSPSISPFSKKLLDKPSDSSTP